MPCFLNKHITNIFSHRPSVPLCCLCRMAAHWSLFRAGHTLCTAWCSEAAQVPWQTGHSVNPPPTPHRGMPPTLQLHTQTLLMSSCLCDLNLICVLKWERFAFCLYKSTCVYNLLFSFFLQVFLLIQSEKIKSDFVYLSWLARCCESLYSQHCRIQILLYCVTLGNPLS